MSLPCCAVRCRPCFCMSWLTRQHVRVLTVCTVSLVQRWLHHALQSLYVVRATAAHPLPTHSAVACVCLAGRSEQGVPRVVTRWLNCCTGFQHGLQALGVLLRQGGQHVLELPGRTREHSVHLALALVAGRKAHMLQGNIKRSAPDRASLLRGAALARPARSAATWACGRTRRRAWWRA